MQYDERGRAAGSSGRDAGARRSHSRFFMRAGLDWTSVRGRPGHGAHACSAATLALHHQFLHYNTIT